MKLTGNVWKYGDNVDTDAIIPARYLNMSLPEETRITTLIFFRHR